MIKKYVKKPLEIEAIQLTKDSVEECIEFVFNIGMETCMFARNFTIADVIIKGGFLIPTLEGNLEAKFGDYIIKGIKGEFYPCKPDIFIATYEEVR